MKWEFMYAGSGFLILASVWTQSMAAPPDPIGYWKKPSGSADLPL
jgi:hypothetical protein